MLFPGKINKLVVDRKSVIGYMLKDQDSNEVFLHNNDSNHLECKNGDEVDAFLYYDNKGRLAATLKTPEITLGERKFLTVTGLNYSVGVFLSFGISKDLLLSNKELPFDQNEWPKVGDKLYIEMHLKGRLVGVLVKGEKVENNHSLRVNDKVNATIQEIRKRGYLAITDKFEYIFIQFDQVEKKYRLGEQVVVTIYFISQDYPSGKIILNKEFRVLDNYQIILDYLNINKFMNFDAKSKSEDIFKEFNMSKNDFKFAIGKLYREQKVRFEDGKTILV
jgi:predicted RNA-binding protein (virulence factor B family)